MRRATTQRVTPRITGKMANPSALCKSENFDSIDQVETTSDTLTGRAGLTFQITWDRSVADAVLRGGSRSSNDGDTAIEAIRHLTKKIRKALGEEIPIVVRMDTGFCDKKIYQACEDLGIGCVGIGYLSGGRLQEAIKDEAEKRPRLRLGPLQLRWGPLSERFSGVGLPRERRPTWNLEPFPTDDPHAP